MEDAYFMDEALTLAREAAAGGEVPVGCVIVRGTPSSAGDATAGRRTSPPSPTRR